MSDTEKDRWSKLAKQAAEKARRKKSESKRMRYEETAKLWKSRMETFRRPGSWSEALRKAWKNSKERSKKRADGPIGNVAIVGAGVRGLAVAHRLARSGCRVTMFDSNVAGGAVRTILEGGFLVEAGPSEMVSNTNLVECILDEIGLEERRVFVSGKKVGVLKDRKIQLLPRFPLELLRTRLLDPGEKLRIILEPFKWKKRTIRTGKRKRKVPLRTSTARGEHNVYFDEEEETISHFVKRHFQSDACLKLAEPLFSGYAGHHPDSTPVKYLGSWMHAIEQKYGSLVLGGLSLRLGLERAAQMLGSGEPSTGRVFSVSHSSMVKEKDAGRISSSSSEPKPLGPDKLLALQGEYRLDISGMVRGMLLRKPHVKHFQCPSPFSFPNGMQELTNALVESVGRSNINEKSPVVALDRTELGEFHRPVWQVSCSSGPWRRSMDSFDAVVFAAPLSSLLRGSVELYDHDKKVPVGWMPQVKYAPVSVVAAVFNKKDVPDMTQIQRIKVPASEDYMNCYEIALSHNASPGSQEEEQVLVTGYMGGPDNPRLAKKDDLSLKQKLQKDLKNLLGKTPNPVFMRSFFWHDAAAQFPEGYGNSIRALRKLEDLLPGLYFAGDYHGEQDMGSILTSADISASKILNDLIVIKHLKGKELFALWDFRGRNDLTVQHQIEQRSKKMQANKDIVYKLLEEEANQYRSAPPSKHDDASPPSKVDETQETSTPLAKQEDPPPKIFSLDEWKPKLVAWIHQLGKEKKETEEELPEMTAEERRKFLQERLRMLEKLRREEVLRQLDREKESAKHAREMAMMEVRQEQHRQRKS